MSLPTLKYTPEDTQALDTLQHKQDHLRTAVTALHNGYDMGLFVWGEGGVGKSYIVEDQLKKVGADYILHNSRITARGLVDRLEQRPKSIHWIEDAETLLDDKKSFGVIRSACWSQSNQRPRVREITWTAFKTEIRFNFTGSILVVSNVNLIDASPEIRAIKTRVKILNMDVTNQEVFALMKQICQAGYSFGDDELSPNECWEVACFIIGKLMLLNRQLDLRLLRHGFHDYMMSQHHHTTLSWKELLSARMEERPSAYKTRAVRTAEESGVAVEINNMAITGAEKIKLWEERTGRSKAAFYRMLKKKS